MATNATKIRVGAPDLMILDAVSASPVDVGASNGGAVLAYNATYFPVEIDQTILAANAYKTKEEIMFSVTLVQSQASTLVAALSLQSTTKSTVASGTMGAGPICTATPVSAASGHYTYAVVPFNYNGDLFPVSLTTITTGPTALGTGTSGVTIAWATVPSGAQGIKILRLVNAGSTTVNVGLLATLYSYAVPGSYLDTGQTATAYVPAGTGGISSQGTTTYTAGTAVDSTASYTSAEVGGFVIAGASISSVITAASGTTLTFSSWTGGTPTGGTPFYVSPNAAPATPNVDTVTFGGDMSVPQHTFDWAVPKNDGTQNHWLGHFRKCFSAKQVSIDYSKTKETDLSKLELQALADTTQPVGSQAGYLSEMYS